MSPPSAESVVWVYIWVSESICSCPANFGMQLALDIHMEAGVGIPKFSLMSGFMEPLVAYPACLGSQSMVRGQEKDHLVCRTGLQESLHQMMPRSTKTVQALWYPATPPQYQLGVSNEECVQFSAVPG